MTIREFKERHPEWWLFALSIVCWFALIQHVESSDAAHTASHGRYAMAIFMLIAMMVPLCAFDARHVAMRSLRPRRHRAMLAFLIGYCSVWAFAGQMLTELAGGLVDLGSRLAVPGWALAAWLAGLWQFHAVKARALRGCHQTEPITLYGVKADASCMRYGIVHGGRCVASCCGFMLISSAMNHAIIASAAVLLLCALERFAFRPPTKVIGAALVTSAALAVGMIAVLPL